MSSDLFRRYLLKLRSTLVRYESHDRDNVSYLIIVPRVKTLVLWSQISALTTMVSAQMILTRSLDGGVYRPTRPMEAGPGAPIGWQFVVAQFDRYAYIR